MFLFLSLSLDPTDHDYDDDDNPRVGILEATQMTTFHDDHHEEDAEDGIHMIISCLLSFRKR